MKAKPPSGSSKKAKPPVSQESFGLPGKTYKTPANAVKTTSLPKENKTKRLAGMQGPSNFKNKSLGEFVNAALAVTSVAGLSKAVAARQLATSVGKEAREAFLNKQAANKAKYGEPPKAPPSRSLTNPPREKPSFLKPPVKIKLKEIPKITPTTRKVVQDPVKIKTPGTNPRYVAKSNSPLPQLRASYARKVEQYERLFKGTPVRKPPLNPGPKPPLKALPKPPKR